MSGSTRIKDTDPKGKTTFWGSRENLRIPMPYKNIRRVGWEPVSPTWRKRKNPIRVEDTDSHPTQENNLRMRQDPGVNKKNSRIQNNNIKRRNASERIHKKKTDPKRISRLINLLGRYQEKKLIRLKRKFNPRIRVENYWIGTLNKMI